MDCFVEWSVEYCFCLFGVGVEVVWWIWVVELVVSVFELVGDVVVELGG